MTTGLKKNVTIRRTRTGSVTHSRYHQKGQRSTQHTARSSQIQDTSDTNHKTSPQEKDCRTDYPSLASKSVPQLSQYAPRTIVSSVMCDGRSDCRQQVRHSAHFTPRNFQMPHASTNSFEFCSDTSLPLRWHPQHVAHDETLCARFKDDGGMLCLTHASCNWYGPAVRII